MNEMLNVVVDGLWCQGDRSLAVRLVSASGEPLPGWEPGAHIDVHLPCGLIRQYSLTGDNRAGSYLICVAQERASRGGSRYIHQTLRPGQRLLISAPRNLFALRDDGPVLLLAAGIGITPLYAMLLQREATGRPFVLHYFVKRREEGAFLRELSRPLKHGICVVHCSAEGESPRQWLATMLPAPGDEQRIYTCGPEGFMAAVRDAALKKAGRRRTSTARPLRLLPRRRSRKMQRPLRLPWRPAGRNGPYRRIRVSRKCYRIMAWRYRFPARWGSVGPA